MKQKQKNYRFSCCCVNVIFFFTSSLHWLTLVRSARNYRSGHMTFFINETKCIVATEFVRILQYMTDWTQYIFFIYIFRVGRIPGYLYESVMIIFWLWNRKNAFGIENEHKLAWNKRTREREKKSWIFIYWGFSFVCHILYIRILRENVSSMVTHFWFVRFP